MLTKTMWIGAYCLQKLPICGENIAKLLYLPCPKRVEKTLDIQ